MLNHQSTMAIQTNYCKISTISCIRR